MQLSPRKREILRHVVEEYVATGQPVGSRVLVERSGLQVSSSTVRNELAELGRWASDSPASVGRKAPDRRWLSNVRGALMRR
jgi:hypothetical protein